MNISIKGYGENTATFRTQGLVSPGCPVKMADNLTVAPCGADEEFIGIAVNVRGEYACVQLAGYAEVDFSGPAPELGYCALTADGVGGVLAEGAGRQYLVVNVGITEPKAGIIL